MKKIYKYTLRPAGITEVQVPKNGKVLSIQSKGEECCCIWILIDTSEGRTETRRFDVIQTGQSFNDKNMVYLGHYQEDWYVGHVFEIIEGDDK